MQEKDLITYIKGESNPEEKKLIFEWIRKDEEHQRRYNVLKAKFVASNLNTAEVKDMDAVYKNFSIKKKRKRKLLYRTLAAAIILPILSWQFYTSSFNDSLTLDDTQFSEYKIKNVTTSHGGYKTVVLPDGSSITLNAESSLSYPEKFTDTSREVTLEGEAFFDIQRDVTKPFIVHTKHLKVRVLGTSFNVKSYAKDDKIETTLVTGKVEVIQEETKRPIILTPSQRATFNKEKNGIEIDKVDSKRIVAWKQGKLIFDKTSLKQVVLDLNRKYNVDFIIESDSLLHYKYTGEFDNLSLEEVLKLLKISSSINYKYENNKVMLNSE